MELALGLKPHTGWAIAVLVGGDPSGPRVVDRRRITLCPEELPRQLYHYVHHEGMAVGKARTVIGKIERAVEATTTEVLDDLAKVAAEHGELVAAGIVGRPHEVPELEKVLASHTLLHLAEGETYRGALDEAARWQGLRVALAPSKRTAEEVAATLGVPGLPGTLTALRGDLGAPWQADHKDATAAALLALAAS